MKKRIVMLSVVVGVLLSVCGAAWADDYYKVIAAAAAYSKKYNVNATAGTTLDIPIQAAIDKKGSQLDEGYVTGVNQVKFSFSGWEGVLSSEPTINSKDVAFGTFDSYSTAYPETTMTVIAKGTGTVTITATVGGYSKTATIYFSTSNGTDEINSQYKSTDGPNGKVPKPGANSSLTSTVADPDVTKWNGQDPPFGVGNKSGDIYKGNDKDKPAIKTSKVETSKTYTVKKGKGTEEKKVNYFTSGISDDFTIEIQGPNPYVDVYVSAKDAKKLWPLSCDTKYGGVTQTDDIHLTSSDIKKWKIPFRVISYDVSTADGQEKTTKHTVKIAFNGAKVSYKGFPLTISAANDKTLTRTGQKPVTKTFKIDVKGAGEVPQWVTSTGETGDDLSKKNSQEVTVPLHASSATKGEVKGVIYTTSADGPYYITGKGAKDGISLDVVQPVLNKFGEVSDPGYVKIFGTFDKQKTKSGDKEDKVAVTLDAVGSAKKTSFKANVIGKVSPYFEDKSKVTSKDKSYVGMVNTVTGNTSKYDGYYKNAKTAAAGSVPSVKIAAKGSKTITYSISPEDEAKLNKYNMAFDSAKGQVIALVSTDNRTKLKPTATISADDYDPVDLTVTADNATGVTDTIHALVGVTGDRAKPFLGKDSSNKEIKTLVIPKSAKYGDIFPIGANVGKGKDGTASKDRTVKVLFRLADAKDKTEGSGANKKSLGGEDTYALQELGLELVDFATLSTDSKDNYRNHGLIRVTSEDIKKATKGTKINLILSNYGNEQKGTVTIAITDPTPVIVGSGDTELFAESMDIAVLSKDTTSTSKKFRLKLTDATKPTDGAKIEWKIKTDVSTSTKSTNFHTLKVVAVAGDPSQIDLEIRTKQGAGTNVKDSLTITAQNKNSGETSEAFKVNLIINSGDVSGTAQGGKMKAKAKSEKATGRRVSDVVSDLKAGLPADYESTAEEEGDEESAEEGVVFGAPRTAADLTAAQKAFIATKGYTIVAVLPEITAKAEGQHDIEVELDENAPEGAKLIWLPFPKDAGSDDDNIVDFYDEAGALVEGVPASHKIIASPWLREGVTYAPVIAIEAE